MCCFWGFSEFLHVVNSLSSLRKQFFGHFKLQVVYDVLTPWLYRVQWNCTRSFSREFFTPPFSRWMMKFIVKNTCRVSWTLGWCNTAPYLETYVYSTNQRQELFQDSQSVLTWLTSISLSYLLSNWFLRGLWDGDGNSQWHVHDRLVRNIVPEGSLSQKIG